jgi:hypothetical protein
MKNLMVNLLIGSFLIAAMMTACESGGENNPTGKFRFSETRKGGCNAIESDGLKSEPPEEQPDTSWYSVEGDSLIFFAGVNYICCTPFTTTAEIRNDSLIMTINDTCDMQVDVCYCKCMCYYTFDFIFLEYSGEHYSWQVSCYDKLAHELIILGTGKL